MGIEVASTGVQVHGGMGFVEETGAAQHYRDARILAIYEGTNGIQSIDLVMRKLPLAGGETVRASIARYRAAAEANESPSSTIPRSARPASACAKLWISLERATDWMLARHWAPLPPTRWPARPLICACSAWLPAVPTWPKRPLPRVHAMQSGESDPAHGRRIRDCRFFAEKQCVRCALGESSMLSSTGLRPSMAPISTQPSEA